MSTTTLPPPAPQRTGAWAWAALVVSFLGSAGSYYLSVGMGLMPCPLCFYQRAFMLGVFAVLAVGLVAGLERTVPLGLLALPLATAGLAVAGYHVNLERVRALESGGEGRG